MKGCKGALTLSKGRVVEDGLVYEDLMSGQTLASRDLGENHRPWHEAARCKASVPRRRFHSRFRWSPRCSQPSKTSTGLDYSGWLLARWRLIPVALPRYRAYSTFPRNPCSPEACLSSSHHHFSHPPTLPALVLDRVIAYAFQSHLGKRPYCSRRKGGLQQDTRERGKEDETRSTIRIECL